MARRDLKQLSFAEGLIKQRAGRNEWFEEIARVLDWAALERVLAPIYASDEGRPSYPLLTFVKIVLLQQWYGLSDPAMEEALDDRLSFRRFCGLPLDEGVPDHTTIWRFRQELAQRGLAEAVFGEVNRQLAARGLFIKRGTLIDATVVAAAVKPPAGETGAVSEGDPQAGWTKKGGKSVYGYKGHVGVDEGSGLVHAAELTSADLHDSQRFAGLVREGDKAVYADKAYASAAHRAWLAERGIKDGVMQRAASGKPLKPWQTSFNKAVSPIRAAVERVFALLKRRYGWRRARYLGLARNACHFQLLLTAMNIRRALALTA